MEFSTEWTLGPDGRDTDLWRPGRALTCRLMLWAGISPIGVARALIEGYDYNPQYHDVWVGLDPGDGALLIEVPGAWRRRPALLTGAPDGAPFVCEKGRFLVPPLRCPRWWVDLGASRKARRLGYQISDMVRRGEFIRHATPDPTNARLVLVLTPEADPLEAPCWAHA